MDNLKYICMITIILSICSSIFVALFYHFRHKKMLKRMNEMLDRAIDGSFSETLFDESLLSAVETRLNKYLSSSGVSARKIKEDRNKIKELISDISHQTKTPIANILLYAQLLCEQNLPEESSQCAHALAQQAEKLRFLIGSLIKTSRLETNIFSLNPKLSDINPMLCSVINQISPRAREKSIVLFFEGTHEKAHFDEKWTTEAVYNIVDNAVKYTHTNGKITFSVTAYQLFCRIDIADTGIGIAEEEQAKVFTRFYRSQDVSDAEGVGIGLYIAREIISTQGGFIKIKSEPQKGSTFSVFLPIEK